jgi:methylmalonyl-CoA/ethylmalonyl-CoA epimerase
VDSKNGEAMLNLQKLHHIGYVVRDLKTGLDGLITSLSATWDGHVYDDPHQRVKVAFLDVTAGAPSIELVQPLSDDSPVQRFLVKSGGGLHHVCFEVTDLEQQMQAMQARHCLKIRSPKPAVAFGGRRIAWMLTREHLLIELLESDHQHSE